MQREYLGVDELRNLESGTYLIVELHDDEYWQQGEGTVEYVTEYDDGRVHIGVKGRRGHPNKLKIPADGRRRMRYNGAASGAHNLRVDGVRSR